MHADGNMKLVDCGAIALLLLSCSPTLKPAVAPVFGESVVWHGISADSRAAESSMISRQLLVPARQRDFKEVVLPMPPSEGQKFSLNLFPDAIYTVTVESVDQGIDGAVGVTGEISASIFGRALLSIHGQNIRGNVNVDGRTFVIVPVGDGLHLLYELDATKLPGGGGAVKLPAPSVALPQSVGNDTELRILLVFPAELSVYCSDSQWLDPYRLQVVDAFKSARVTPVKIDVRSFCVEDHVSGGGDLLDDLKWLASSMDVRNERLKNQADLVSLTVAKGTDCGRAYINEPPISNTAKDRAFSVVQEMCFNNYSFIHELGHNLGLLHDRVSEGGGEKTDCNYGFGDPKLKYRTIMAEQKICDADNVVCSRIFVFSDPTASVPKGIPCTVQQTGIAGSANNAAQLRDAVPVAARFLP
jgi:hypothetical protein